MSKGFPMFTVGFEVLDLITSIAVLATGAKAAIIAFVVVEVLGLPSPCVDIAQERGGETFSGRAGRLKFLEFLVAVSSILFLATEVQEDDDDTDDYVDDNDDDTARTARETRHDESIVTGLAGVFLSVTQLAQIAGRPKLAACILIVGMIVILITWLVLHSQGEPGPSPSSVDFYLVPLNMFLWGCTARFLAKSAGAISAGDE
jgi:hypothetical protein